MILYVNACVRKDSRTKRLADRLIEKLNGTVEEARLDTISFPIAAAGMESRRSYHYADRLPFPGEGER